MKIPSLALIANGSCDVPEEILKKIKTWIAVDGGVKHCIRHNLVPQIYVGDLDSANEADLAKFPNIEKHIFPRDKDRTDLELALELAFSMTSEVLPIFGALGGRMDHSLYNLYLLSRFPSQLRFISQNEIVFAIDKKIHISTSPGKTLSLMPLGNPVKGVSTKGLQYELKDATLDKNLLSLSNVTLNSEVLISLSQGSLICFLEKAIS
jgi:thiamine pyrophosphokinase